VVRRCQRAGGPAAAVGQLQQEVARRRVALLTYEDAEGAAAVRLMGLYQSKGREADSTVVVLRSGDYFGKGSASMEAGSRLLYVLYTRARQRTVTLAFGSGLPDLIAPLTRLAAT